jgi:hypothetical protein
MELDEISSSLALELLGPVRCSVELAGQLRGGRRWKRSRADSVRGAHDEDAGGACTEEVSRRATGASQAKLCENDRFGRFQQATQIV